MYLGAIQNTKAADKVILAKIANKLFNYPGFYEGVMEASNLYQFKNLDQFEIIWQDISKFLKYYQYSASTVSDYGVCEAVIFPFTDKEDVELVRLIMINYLK